jgi:cytochrome c
MLDITAFFLGYRQISRLGLISARISTFRSDLPMNGFEFNKVLAAILLAMLIAMVTGFIAHHLVEPEKLKKNVYVVEGVQAADTGGAAAAPKGPPPIEPLLAKANVEAGQKYARVCGTCHSFGKGEAAIIGPNLYGVVNGPHDHMPGYDYSDAMKAMRDAKWTVDELNEFLYNPRGHIPGTKMTFAGIKNDQDRANVIAWLKTLSDNPQ